MSEKKRFRPDREIEVIKTEDGMEENHIKKEKKPSVIEEPISDDEDLEDEEDEEEYEEEDTGGVKDFFISFGVTLLIIGLIVWISYSVFTRSRSLYYVRSCQSNCKGIATALEMYASDHDGNYPDTLNELIPEYLTLIPICPSGGRDTYSQTYKTGRDNESGKINGFTFFCNGENHVYRNQHLAGLLILPFREKSEFPHNFPVFTSIDGLKPPVVSADLKIRNEEPRDEKRDNKEIELKKNDKNDEGSSSDKS